MFLVHFSRPRRSQPHRANVRWYTLFAATIAEESLLSNRELVDLWCDIGQNVVSFLVECELCGNQIRQVSKWLGLEEKDVPSDQSRSKNKPNNGKRGI